MEHAPEQLRLEVAEDEALSTADKATILSLCNRAFERDLTSLMLTHIDPVHVIGRVDGAIVSHAMWVTRWLQVGDGDLLRTAYVEAVATEPELQRRG